MFTFGLALIAQGRAGNSAHGPTSQVENRRTVLDDLTSAACPNSRVHGGSMSGVPIRFSEARHPKFSHQVQATMRTVKSSGNQLSRPPRVFSAARYAMCQVAVTPFGGNTLFEMARGESSCAIASGGQWRFLAVNWPEPARSHLS